MIVLDTNVISELMRTTPEPRVVGWVDANAAADVFMTAVTAAQLTYGVARLPEGRRKRQLVANVGLLLEVDFDDQVLPFDGLAAAHHADIVVCGNSADVRSAWRAAICRRWTADLATRNVADFTDTGVRVVNPWAPDE